MHCQNLAFYRLDTLPANQLTV